MTIMRDDIPLELFTETNFTRPTVRTGTPTPATSSHTIVREPLAARMRPRTLDEFVGQEQIIGQGRALRRAIDNDTIPSMILWGPPGTGKTTLAGIIAEQTGSEFVAISAVSAGVADIRRIVADAARLKMSGKRSVLFIDEIHRFNKSQQDAVLPYVEDGTVTLIGATTENPSFEVNSALLSRSRVFVLTSLNDEHIRALLERAIHDTERGLGKAPLAIADGALEALVNLANGDARAALGTLEFAAASAPLVRGVPTIDEQSIHDALQKRVRSYDKSGDGHYDIISAFQKSIRGSDPDAAIYYLARMIESGEDPMFIARRLVVIASEDVGLADSQALQVAMSAQQALHFLGMPEGHYPLSHATLYLAMAPKSNTIGRAYSAAMVDVETSTNEPIPIHLRKATSPLMRQLGYGKGYQYAHDAYAALDATGDSPPAVVLQSNLPPSLSGRQYVEPTKQGQEARMYAWVRERRRGKKK
jgi:putative ATPase